MDILLQAVFLIALIVIIIFLYLQFNQTKKNEKFDKQNRELLESIEKYIEIFNEQNVKELIETENGTQNSLAEEKIRSIRKDYRAKLASKNKNLSEEHETLIDFITLSLAMLIKTPPQLREKIIDDTTQNEEIRQILKSQLPAIERHYLPVSLLEIAISKNS